MFINNGLVIECLNQIKKEGLIDNFGISVYNPEDVNASLDYKEINVIQVPINIFDHRLINSGLLKKLKGKNYIILARSIYLQGLFFILPEKLPKNLQVAKDPLLKLEKFKRGIASVAENDDDVIVRIPERKFIFIPLQMMDDINNIRYSPLIHHNLQLVKLVLNNPPPEGYDIIIKRHPWDTIFADSLYMRTLDEIIKHIKNYDNVHLYYYADSQILLKHCSALITMNSTLSMENLLEVRVPMVILGDNFVRGWGFTYDVNNLSEYPEKLKEALEK